MQQNKPRQLANIRIADNEKYVVQDCPICRSVTLKVLYFSQYVYS